MDDPLNKPQLLHGALGGRACLPSRYLVDFLELLHERRDEIEVLTYADLPWGDDWDYENHYPVEFARWKRQMRSGQRDRRKIHVILQHDVDNEPQRTMALLREEQRLGLRSNVMIFNQRVNRRVLQKTGRMEYKRYEIDHEELRRMQAAGFVIGYHSNAYEQALFDREKASAIFERDVAELRRHFDIRFFCPHGGVRDAEGHSNAALDIPPSLRQSLRWVLNRHTARFDGSYSDGAMNSPKREADNRDLRRFVETWRPGKRYRILIHPQYYDKTCFRTRRLSGVPWYEEVLSCYEGTPPRSAWDS